MILIDLRYLEFEKHVAVFCCVCSFAFVLLILISLPFYFIFVTNFLSFRVDGPRARFDIEFDCGERVCFGFAFPFSFFILAGGILIKSLAISGFLAHCGSSVSHTYERNSSVGW